MKYRIDKVAIIGAGTMGGGIAAHLANIGIKSILLDIVTPGLSDEESQDRQARNRLVQTLFDRMAKARPANLARKDRGDLITIGNIEDDFELIADCDWIIEVIIEQLKPKQELMAKVEAIRKPGSIVSSNTSGIPIKDIADGRSEDFKAHFLGTHFFNPPRYLKLLELIPTADTSAEVMEFFDEFARDVLGKGVVVCKDTPNFIANRFFAVAGSYGIAYAIDHGYSVSEIDSITGPLVGRPKTATFRLLDLVGIDIMGHVFNNLYEAIDHDAYREVMRSESLTKVLEGMIGRQWLGNKSGQGFYKQTFVNGNREFWTINPETFEYEAPEKVRFDSVGAVRKIDNISERLPALFNQAEDRAVTYLRDTLLYTLAYAAYVTPEIAYSLADVDSAIKWGFGHEVGPFEIWDILGVEQTAKQMEEAGHEVASWVKEFLDAGNTSFYKNGSYYDFDSKSYRSRPVDSKVQSVQLLKDAGAEVAKNTSASLYDMGDGIALLEMHSPKINAVDVDFMTMAQTALDRLESDFDGLVIGNNGQDFCIGANVAMMVIAAAQGLWDQIEEAVRVGQEVFFKLRHAPKPVVTAPHQRVLGGGVELTMASWASVADHEVYMGFVEPATAGIIPAWCGCKELLRRKVNPVMRTDNADVLPIMGEVAAQVIMAKVGTSAWENKELGYLKQDDVVVMNSDHRLAMAKEKALQLYRLGVRPPEVEKVYAAGQSTYSAAKLLLQGFVWADYASEHDLKIGQKLVYVLCGGELSQPAWVDPWYIMDLEREAVLSLVGEPLTQARMTHVLQTGKPLRN